MMNDETKSILIQTQLNNATELLGGTIRHQTGRNSGGRNFARYIIEYDVREEWPEAPEG